ncbi:unnamed protein product [Effrenium voratum]|uniref:Uncharacterized protein n=1 Tax=Effrenium voratum TaxID=2562239 RepID=A0AA36IG43_9DINO|nr:unnamed protein product [Effrenium voratum]
MSTRAHFGGLGSRHYGSSNLGRRKATSARRPRQVQRAQNEEGFFNTGLTLQVVSVATIRAWLAFQVVSLVLQYNFWREVGGNLALFDDTLSVHCAPERSKHGVCIGPLWNVSTWEEFVLQGRMATPLPAVELKPRPHVLGGFGSIEAIDTEIAQLERETALRLKQLRERRAELQMAQGLVPLGNQSRAFNASYIFQFETRSSPPVFLVSLHCVAKARHAGEEPPTVAPSAVDELDDGQHWSLEVRRLEPESTVPHFQRQGFGTRIVTVEDLSEEALGAVRSRGRVRWEAVVRNVEMSQRRARFVAFVEDFQAPHLEKIYSSQCSLTAAWKAFNQQHQGHHHRALALCRDLLGWLLPLAALATWAVYANALRTRKEREDLELPASAEVCENAGDVDVGHRCLGGYEFQAVVCIKLIVMDIPQQICIVLYLLGWYELEGLRCQLCLFHPAHCEDEHPFRLVNSAAFACTLLSSVTNQIIFGPRKGDDDECCRWTMRIGLICVSVLPFTTGIFWATAALLSLPGMAKALVFVPCVIGWFCVLAGVLSCMIACCGDM